MRALKRLAALKRSLDARAARTFETMQTILH